MKTRKNQFETSSQKLARKFQALATPSPKKAIAYKLGMFNMSNEARTAYFKR